MNCHRLHLTPGTRLTDGTNVFRYWGNMRGSGHSFHLVYIFFDRHDVEHVMTSKQVLQLKPI